MHHYLSSLFENPNSLDEFTLFVDILMKVKLRMNNTWQVGPKVDCRL